MAILLQGQRSEIGDERPEMKDSIKNFKDLRVWQQAHKLELLVYSLTMGFPRSELFGLTNQLRRAATSVTANIAEGMGRGTYSDRVRFYYNSRGSIYEVESLVFTAKDLGYMEQGKYDEVSNILCSIRMLLGAFITKTHMLSKNKHNKT